jgi:predicted nucleic-acid-binding protein
MTRIDTNYIIRYLVADNIQMADITEQIITKENIFIANEILAEVVYVLSKVYGISRQNITKQLLTLVNFNNIEVSNFTVIINALELFRDKKLDFVDCLLCSYSTQDKVMTFDKNLNKCIDSL